MVKSKEKSNLI